MSTRKVSFIDVPSRESKFGIRGTPITIPIQGSNSRGTAIPVPSREPTTINVPVVASTGGHEAGVSQTQVSLETSSSSSSSLSPNNNLFSSSTTMNKRVSSETKNNKIPRKKRKILPWEDDPYEEPLDLSEIKMADLCRDVKVGRKSSKFKKLAKKKYMEAQRKRQERKARAAAARASVSSSSMDPTNNEDDNDVGIQENNENSIDFQDIGVTSPVAPSTSNIENEYNEDEVERIIMNDAAINDSNDHDDVVAEGEIDDDDDDYEDIAPDQNEDENESLENYNEPSETIEEAATDNEAEELDEDLLNDPNITLVRSMQIQESSIAPQIRCVDGKVVLDIESLQVDREATARSEEANAPLRRLVENDLTRLTNSLSYLPPRQKTMRWTPEDNELFFKGLSQWGTDFGIIAKMFPHRNRKQIKAKYKRESKQNKEKVDYALKNKIPIDIEEYSKVSGIEIPENIEFAEVEPLEVIHTPEASEATTLFHPESPLTSEAATLVQEMTDTVASSPRESEAIEVLNSPTGSDDEASGAIHEHESQIAVSEISEIMQVPDSPEASEVTEDNNDENYELESDEERSRENLEFSEEEL
ncbi:8580_t:CDS:2 [Ambispora gerdemannii]|uniref:8580_t:CDS:1 n=1 Tax=Ambispora gerdemannii TaxID=144530 RepID=A0A9N9EZR5_9GLOM|nr:8580_t:CDS:2 [Ambispora gerdemannii]